MTPFSGPDLSRSNGSHPQREGSNLGVFVPTWLVLPGVRLHTIRRVPPCAVKTCAVRPVFARVVGEMQVADPSNVQGLVKQNASPGAQSEAPRPRWKPGQEQNPGQENQDSQHMLEQPRGSFPN